MTNVERLLEQLLGLSPDERRRFAVLAAPLLPLERASAATPLPAMQDLGDARFAAGLVCLHCGATAVARWGSYRGRQRYRCKSCRRTLTGWSGTPLHQRWYPERWTEFCACMIRGLSVRETARALGVHRDTAFRWRHRFLAAVPVKQQVQLSGVVEAAETNFRHSEKGSRSLRGHRRPRRRGEKAPLRGLSRELVCVLTARDRRTHTVAKVAGRGSPSVRRLAANLAPQIGAGVQLVTDQARAYRRFGRAAEAQHLPVTSRKGGRHLRIAVPPSEHQRVSQPSQGPVGPIPRRRDQVPAELLAMAPLPRPT